MVRIARREALIALGMWLCALAYTITYCYLFGYGRSAEDLKFILGFPDWVFYGIIAPWTVCFVASYWFAFFFMTDADLGGELPESEGTASPREMGDV